MKELIRHDKEKVIDVLTERLVFERTGVKFYDAVCQKIEQSEDQQIKRMLGKMREFRDEEKEHADWLETQIRELGGDPNAKTEKAALVETESRGFEEILLDGHEEIPHLFHALLSVELSDNASWALLVELAEEADDEEAKRQFKRYLHQEEDHLDFVKRAMERFAEREVLGERARFPER